MAQRGINKVILIGNIGQDPESRSFPDGGTVTNISIATSESWKDKQGQTQERTEWNRVVLRDRGNYKLGQIAAQYLQKGSKVYIEGSLRTRKWQDNQGVDRYTTEIIAEQMQMLDGRQESHGEQAYREKQATHVPERAYNEQPTAAQVYPDHQYTPTRQQPAQQQPAPDFSDFDDSDIPF